MRVGNYTDHMRYRIPAAAHIVVLIAFAAAAQTRTPMKPTVPGRSGDPVWQGTVHMSDGRVFITDGGLAVDAAFAKPPTLPTREVPGKVLEDYLKATHKDECGFADLTLAATGKTYTSPNGIELNATYIDYLRRVAPRGSRFRMTDGMHPIVVVAAGTPMAVLMPVKK
jgi:hypothetical protein